MRAALLALALFAGTCCPAAAPPVGSLAAVLRRPPPTWYQVEASPLPACGPGAPAPCCPAEAVCLTVRGGRALVLNKLAFEPWAAEAWARCGAAP